MSRDPVNALRVPYLLGVLFFVAGRACTSGLVSLRSFCGAGLFEPPGRKAGRRSRMTGRRSTPGKLNGDSAGVGHMDG